MITVRDISKFSFKAVGTNIVLKIASLFKVSLIIGSIPVFFSLTSMVMPLTGVYGGALVSTGVCALAMVIKLFFGTVPSLKFLAYHIPGLFAALYWAHSSFTIRFLVPLICIGAFIAHPVGAQAWLYTAYWLIPLAVYLFKKDSVWHHAVASTLVAHAVGSVIWIWADPMLPEVWLALIPVVFVERLVFAAGMALSYLAIEHALAMTKRISFLATNKNLNILKSR